MLPRSRSRALLSLALSLAWVGLLAACANEDNSLGSHADSASVLGDVAPPGEVAVLKFADAGAHQFLSAAGEETCGHVQFFVAGRTGCKSYDACTRKNCGITGKYCMGKEFWTKGQFDPERPCGAFVPCMDTCDCESNAKLCVHERCGGANQLMCLPCVGEHNTCAKTNCGELTDHCPKQAK